MSDNAIAHPTYGYGLRVEPEERDLVIKVLDALIVKNDMEATLKSMEG